MKKLKIIPSLIQIFTMVIIIIALAMFNYFQNRIIIKNLSKLSPDINSELVKVAITSIIFGIFIAIIVTVLIQMIQSKRTKGAFKKNDLEDESENIGNSSSLHVKSNDELLVKYEELNDYTQEIKASMSELSNFTDSQAAYIEQFSAALTEASSGVQQTSENAQQAAEFVENVSNSVRVFVDSIGEVALIAKEVSNESENAKTTAKDGEKVITSAIDEMNNVLVKIKDLLDYITLLGESTNEIGNIIDLINNITNQTNMLALNASIEAARAGEYGKGFSVVARSIKELADKSKGATSSINEIIKNIQHSINEAVNKSNESFKELESGMSLVKSTGGSIGEILLAVDKTCEHSITLAESTTLQDETSKEIMNFINELNSIIQDISATTIQESSSIQQITAGLDLIKESISELAGANNEIITFADVICDTTEGLINVDVKKQD